MKRNKHRITTIVMLLFMIFLSGCLYPNEQRAGSQISPADSITLVQSAVDRYQADRSLLPIKNFDMNTPIYERYQIDFSQLIKLQYLSVIPAQAFENGGSNIFVIVNAEDDPTVKMMDIVSIQLTGELQNAVREYMGNHDGNIPAGEAVHNGWYQLDLKKIGKESTTYKSVFSGQNTSWLIHESGQVAVDYAKDIMILIDREQMTDIPKDLDLRSLLVDHAYYVPVKSMPYYWQDQMPVIAAP